MKRRLNDWLSAYMDYTEASEHPDGFRLWSGISAISAALQRRVWLPQGIFTWYPNFYVFFVAPSGVVSKSTCARIAMSLVREVEGVRFGPRSATWQGLVTKLAESQDLFPVNGHGFEGDMMPQSAIAIECGELGTFLNPHDREQVDTLVDLYDCPDGAWEKWTKNSGDDKIINPCITVIGCTTPSWIADNCSTYFIGGGFASRCIFIYEDKKRKLVPYPERDMDPNRIYLRDALVDDLRAIFQMTGPFKMTESAVAWGEDWYYKHNYEPHEFKNVERFGGYMARKQAHIHKLAMIKAAAHSNELEITEKHLQWAEQKITSLEKFLPLIYGKVDQDRESRFGSMILEQMMNYQKLEKMNLYRLFRGQMNHTAFDLALDSLVKSGDVRLINEDNEIYVELRV